jgi:hypothetical protein
MRDLNRKFHTAPAVSAWRSSLVLELLMSDAHPAPRLFMPPGDAYEGCLPPDKVDAWYWIPARVASQAIMYIERGCRSLLRPSRALRGMRPVATGPGVSDLPGPGCAR